MALNPFAGLVRDMQLRAVGLPAEAARKCSASGMTSTGRSRSGGITTGDHASDVIEVLLEFLLADHLVRLAFVAATTRTLTGIDCGAADAGDDLLLQNAEQLGLSAGGHVADLVEEQRTALSQFELAMCVA